MRRRALRRAPALLLARPALRPARRRRRTCAARVRALEAAARRGGLPRLGRRAPRELDRAASSDVPDERAARRTSQGRVAFEEGRYADAVALLEQAGVEDKPGSYLRLAKDTLRHHQGPRAGGERALHLPLPARARTRCWCPTRWRRWRRMRARAGGGPRLRAAGEDPRGGGERRARAGAGLDPHPEADRHHRHHRHLQVQQADGDQPQGRGARLRLAGHAGARVHAPGGQPDEPQHVPIWLHEGLAKYLESRWRGPAGKALPPSTRALLGERVKENNLIPFDKMHPSMAMLPTAKDAATAFAEVFFAIDYLHQEHGTQALRTIVDDAGHRSRRDQQAVEAATGKSFADLREGAGWRYIREAAAPREKAPRHRRAPGAQGRKDTAAGRRARRGGRSPSATSTRWPNGGPRWRAPGRAVARAQPLRRRRRGVREGARAWWATSTSPCPTSTRSRCWS